MVAVLRLRYVSFRLNEADYKELKQLVNKGYYPSISEAIRFAIKDLIRYHRTRIPIGRSIDYQ